MDPPSKTMRAIGVRANGPPDKLELVEVPAPVINGPDDIIVEVKAVGLNPGDPLRSGGYTKVLESMKFPFIIGHDFAGIVKEVGTSVRDFKAGDRVFGFTFGAGTAATYLRLHPGIPMRAIAHLPENVSFVDAASLPSIGIAVVESLRHAETSLGGPGSLKGKTVLVPAALSGVGSLTLQVLKSVFGAGKVVTTVSTKKMGMVEELLGEGKVDLVVDYTQGVKKVLERVGKGSTDFMLDTAFVGMSYLPLLKAKTGLLLSITPGKTGAIMKDDWPEIGWWLVKLIDLVDSYFKWRAWWGDVRYENVHVKPNARDLETVAGWLAEGKVSPIIGKVAKMEDVEAVRAMCKVIKARTGGVGKYVIDLE